MARTVIALALATGMLVAAKPPPQSAGAGSPVAVSASNTVRGGVERWRAGDHAAAVAVWRPYAETGDPDALFNMGQAYKLGRGVNKDPARAADFYRRAALKQHLPAQANLGIILFQSGEKAEAFKWLRAAADRGEPRAQYVLGIALYNGDSIPRAQGLAYGYLLRAAASNLPQATNALGTIAPALAPADRTAGEAIAASIAAGTGVPAALSARLAPRLITVPGTTSDATLKPAPKAAPLAPPLPATASAAVRPPPLLARPATDIAVVKPSATPAATVGPPAPAVSVGVAAKLAPTPTVAKPVPASTVAALPAAAPAASPAGTIRPEPAPIVTAAVPPSIAPSSSIGTPSAAVPAAGPPVVAAKPPPFTAPPATASAPKPTGWRVQLGAFSARKQADAAWRSVRTEHGPVVADAKPIFDDAGPVTRLQLGPYASRAAARAVCTKLADAGRACFVVQG